MSWRRSHQGTQIIAYYRHAPANGTQPEDWVMVLLNFGAASATITVPFPKAGAWQEMLDADQRSYIVNVAHDNDSQTILVPSNYGHGVHPAEFLTRRAAM